MAVSADDPRPPYLQVADDLRVLIATGALAPGQRVPSGRELAEQHGVALMTVQKALALLRDEGVLATHQGRGTFVAAAGGEAPAEPSTEFAEISRQLVDLRNLVQQTAQRLEDRLTALEESAALTPEVRRSPQQRG